MSCPSCNQPLGCAVDCPRAPWNWDAAENILPKTTRLGYLKRLVRWCRPGRTYDRSLPTMPVGFTLSDLHWLYP